MPEGAVYVGRGAKEWGNPFVVGEPIAYLIPPDGRGPMIQTAKGTIITREMAVEQFRIWVGSCHEDIIADLRGKDLACWCPLDQPCHADVLLRIANR